MACLSGPKKTKNLVERLSGMKTKHANIDSLLDHHAARQLSMVDSDRLYADIQQRLDHANDMTRLYSKSHYAKKWAMGFSAAAAILIVVFLLQFSSPKNLKLPAGQRAAVRLVETNVHTRVKISESEGSQRNSILTVPSAQKTYVSFTPPDRQITQCEVKIIDQNGHIKKEKNQQPSWVIMFNTHPNESRNEYEQEQADIACLL